MLPSINLFAPGYLCHLEAWLIEIGYGTAKLLEDLSVLNSLENSNLVNCTEKPASTVW